MGNNGVISKKNNLTGVILALIIIVLIFFVYKNVINPKLNEIIKTNESASSEAVKLYPSFSVKMGNILDNSTFGRLKIFSRPIKDSGPTGNNNPFMPFSKDESK